MDPADFLAVLEGSGCFECILGPCDPATLPAGSFVVMFENWGIYTGTGFDSDGTAMPTHVVVVDGNGGASDKPGVNDPPRVEVPLGNVFGLYTQSPFVWDPASGTWVVGGPPKVGKGYFYRYTVCYKKTC